MSKKDIFIQYNEHLKCSPSKIYKDGSCFTDESINQIVLKYNELFNEKIDINLSKKKKIDLLLKKIPECKNKNDNCLVDNVDWIKNMNNDDINFHTFRPIGPQKRFQWLNTTNINEIMDQYEKVYTDFRFYGAVPINFKQLIDLDIANINFDKIYKEGIKQFGLVINFDSHWQKGSHWVALYANIEKGKIYYYDSYATKPKIEISNFVKEISLWCYKKHILKSETDSIIDTESNFMTGKYNKYEKSNLDIRYNKIRHQFGNSECGVFSVNFLIKLVRGIDFDNVCKSEINDKKVNECRNTYFRF